mgnify:CR=1 FL=1
MSRILLLQGNQAVVEGAIAAGVKFYGGYPITPSTEIAEQLALRLPQVGGKFMQTEDEIAGLGTVIGASMAGKKAMTATSGPGFSLKQEMLGLACSAEIPCVIVNVQRETAVLQALFHDLRVGHIIIDSSCYLLFPGGGINRLRTPLGYVAGSVEFRALATVP